MKKILFEATPTMHTEEQSSIFRKHLKQIDFAFKFECR